MNNRPMKPTHPGILFNNRVFENMSVVEAANLQEECCPMFITLFCRGLQDLDIRYAQLLAKHTNTSVDLWLNLQFNYDNWMAQYGPFEE